MNSNIISPTDLQLNDESKKELEEKTNETKIRY